MSAQNYHGYGSFAEVTPSDDPADNFPTPTDALFIGTAGDLEIVAANGDVFLFDSHPAGWHRIRAIRIGAANTAALDIVAAWGSE